MKKIVFSKKKLMKIIYYGLLAMLLFFFILNQKLGNMDELWNFSFAKNIHDGLIPYKDFNLITTPLSCFLNSIPLFLDTSLITYRIISFIFYLITIYLLDRIIDKLSIQSFLKYLIIALITIILVNTCSFLDYNFLQIIFILLLINLHLKNPYYKNNKLNIIIPIISGLTIINKQSTGLLIAGANIMFLVLNKYYFKKPISLKLILKEIALTLLPVVIFISYLLATSSINAFYDLAILGLTTFTNKYVSFIFLFELIIIYIPMIIKMYLSKKDIKLWILFIYSVVSISFIIPIVDKFHTAYAIIIPLIFPIIIIDNSLKKIKFEINNKYIHLLVPFIIIICIININSYCKTIKYSDGIYKHLPTTIYQQKVIENVNNYVNSVSSTQNVYILDISATLFNLNINVYHKYFDMFMNGNFGVNGEKEIYEIIDNGNNVFMINNVNSNWQEPTKIINYIKDNYYICGAVDFLTAYCKD